MPAASEADAVALTEFRIVGEFVMTHSVIYRVRYESYEPKNGTWRARNNSDNRSRHVSRGVFVRRRRTINQLLAQQGVFSQQFSSTAREIGQSTSHQVRTGGLR